MPQPCTIVIFGATGDLTHRKLVPALYNLAADGELPPASRWSDSRGARKRMTNFGANWKKRHGSFPARRCATKFGKLLPQSIFYHQSEFGDAAGYKTLAKRLDEN